MQHTPMQYSLCTIVLALALVRLSHAMSTLPTEGVHSFVYKGITYVIPSATAATTTPATTTPKPTASLNLPVPVGSEFAHMIPTKREFVASFIKNRYAPPTDAQYRGFISGIRRENFTNKREVAMFLAQLLHESGGLTVKAEEKCLKNSCRREYRRKRDPSDKFYFGRGYLQLTWSYNYKGASKALFGDPMVLLQDPERVARDEDVAWAAAFWFWRSHIHRNKGVQLGKFGHSTLKLNGDQECGKNAGWLARRRFGLYATILKAFHIDEKPDPSGCY